MHGPQKLLILLISLNRPFRHLDQAQLWARDRNYLRASRTPASARLRCARPAFPGICWGGVRILTLSAASRNADHSTLGIIRATKLGLNSTGQIRTSVACRAEEFSYASTGPRPTIPPEKGRLPPAGTWRRRGKPRDPTPRTCELSRLWVSSFMSPHKLSPGRNRKEVVLRCLTSGDAPLDAIG